MRLRHGIITGASAVAVLAGTTMLAGPASAAPAITAHTAATTTTAPYNGVCGPDYSVIASTPIYNVGVTYVTWSSSQDKVCAVTIRNTAGAREYMNVTLDTWPESTHPVQDPGSYTTYAGPVYIPTPAAGQCLSWSGSIDIYYNGANGNCA